MRCWGMVLHFYQPATQDPQITENVAKSCYLPLLRMLKGKKDVALTVNISGSLLVAMAKLGQNEFFGLVGDLVREGKLELLLSPMHHPLVPITPIELVLQQIEKGRELALKQLWVEPVKGLFLPELGVDDTCLKRLKSEAEFVIVDESAVGSSGVFDYEGLKLVAGNRLMCEIIRSTPKKLEAEKILKYAKNGMADEETIISVHDAEIFGHHYEERGELLARMLESSDFRFIKISEVIARYSNTPKVKKVSRSTWQINPVYQLWEGNKLQKAYLKLAEAAYIWLERIGSELSETDREIATERLNEGWASCHLYWLSNMPWWHPDLVEKGANNLIKCIRMLPLSFEDKAKAEQAHHAFLEAMWLYHWSGEVEKKYKDYDKVREDLLRTLPNWDE